MCADIINVRPLTMCANVGKEALCFCPAWERRGSVGGIATFSVSIITSDREDSDESSSCAPPEKFFLSLGETIMWACRIHQDSGCGRSRLMNNKEKEREKRWRKRKAQFMGKKMGEFQIFPGLPRYEANSARSINSLAAWLLWRWMV